MNTLAGIFLGIFSCACALALMLAVKFVTEKGARALWRAVSGWRLRSTDTHLVIERRHRIIPTHAELAAALEKHKAAERADWTKVRRLEWEIYGQYKTGLDGRPLDDDDPAAHVKEGTPKPVEAAFARSRADERQKIPRTVISAGRNVVISGDASGIIVAGGDVVINHGKPIEDLTPQDISNMTVKEFAELRRRMELLGYHSSDLHKRLTRGIFG